MKKPTKATTTKHGRRRKPTRAEAARKRAAYRARPAEGEAHTPKGEPATAQRYFRRSIALDYTD